MKNPLDGSSKGHPMPSVPKSAQLYQCVACKQFGRLLERCRECHICRNCGRCEECLAFQAKVAPPEPELPIDEHNAICDHQGGEYYFCQECRPEMFEEREE